MKCSKYYDGCKIVILLSVYLVLCSLNSKINYTAARICYLLVLKGIDSHGQPSCARYESIQGESVCVVFFINLHCFFSCVSTSWLSACSWHVAIVCACHFN